MSAFVLICGGVIGELIYRFGDIRDQKFSRLTRKHWSSDGCEPVRAGA
jgi:hypothetical protein